MVIVGGGSGTRFGSDKLMADLGGRPLIQVTVENVVPHVDSCVLVVRAEAIDRYAGLGLGVTVVAGGTTRTESEINGLKAVDKDIDMIGIHDAARPNLAPTLIDDLFATAVRLGGAAPVIGASEVLVERANLTSVRNLRRVQTPQVFKAGILRDAYLMASAAGFQGHDTIDVVQKYTDAEVGAVAGEPTNVKVTYPADLEALRELFRT